MVMRTQGPVQIEGLAPKLIKTEIASYRPVEWAGKNESGYTPLGDLVLVLIDQVDEKTLGGVHIPDDVRERQDLAAESGVVVAMGEGAFVWSADRRRPFVGRKPVVGERVYIERYAGQLVSGLDGCRYRLMGDKQIGAIRERKDG
jgi:chaperonin GroES